MAFSTKWTRAKLRSIVRAELLDPNEKWWTDTELDHYVADWQNRVQEKLELVWGTATYTTALSTSTIATRVTDMLRLDAVYWNDQRLVGRTKADLDLIDRDWRSTDPGVPVVVYQDNYATFSLWPAPATVGTIRLEYPKTLSFVTDTSTMQIPAWTKYSAKNYCLSRAFGRFGPNQDVNIAARYRSKFERQLRKYRSFVAAFFPTKYLSLRPGTNYEEDIVMPGNSSIQY